MSDVVIRGEGLGKRYRIGERERYLALRDVLTRAFTAPFRRGRGRREKSELWALRGVSFEVRQVEVVGVIGRNGAGKSTLLKILARITRPTEGSAEIHGRIGSLLEVGTGFHPELTGRENVFLSGAILGMTRREITRKFDEIVAFSEVEKFIDTPLKHYSSGMQMRLAFAVAAHLEPEILLVDEVLAVGDLQFQRKCFGKIGEVARGGRTILLVSHNLNAVSSLCGSVMVFEGGRLKYFSDNVSHGLRIYGSPDASGDTTSLVRHPGRKTGADAIFQGITIEVENIGLSRCVTPGATVIIQIGVTARESIAAPKISVGVTNMRGERIFAVGTHIGGNVVPSISGPSTIVVRFAVPPLVPGEYSLDIGMYDRTGVALDEVYGAAYLEVLKDNYLSMVDSHKPEMGHIMVRSEWTCSPGGQEVLAQLDSEEAGSVKSAATRGNS